MAKDQLSLLFLNRESQCLIITCDQIDQFVKNNTKGDGSVWAIPTENVINVLFDIASGRLDEFLSPDPAEVNKIKKYTSEIIGDLLARKSLQALLFKNTGR